MSTSFEISLPETVILALGANSSELPRKSVEAIVVQSYRVGKITHAQVGEALGLDRWQTDAFLKNAQAYRPLEEEEFAGDLAKLRSISK